MSRIAPRLPLVPAEGWTDEMREIFVLFEGEQARDKGSSYNVLLTLAHHSGLANSFLRFNHWMTHNATLPERLREIVILYVARKNESDYEWIQHVIIGRRIGLDDRDFEAVKIGPDSPHWSDLERHALRAVDEMAAHSRMEGDTWDVLAAELDRPQMLELMFFIGTYVMLSWIFNSIGLEVETAFRPDQQPASEAS